MSGNNPVDLPQYIIGNEPEQSRYIELLSLILTQWFSSNGFFQANLTTAQVNALLAQGPIAPGTHWLNTTANKMQFVDALGAVRTVTST